MHACILKMYTYSSDAIHHTHSYKRRIHCSLNIQIKHTRYIAAYIHWMVCVYLFYKIHCWKANTINVPVKWWQSVSPVYLHICKKCFKAEYIFRGGVVIVIVLLLIKMMKMIIFFDNNKECDMALYNNTTEARGEGCFLPILSSGCKIIKLRDSKFYLYDEVRYVQKNM